MTPWWEGHSDRPVEVELEQCIVCTHAVLDDPTHRRLDHTAPVRMPDGYWTHAGCEPDYPRVAAELATADRAVESVEFARDSVHGDYLQCQRNAS